MSNVIPPPNDTPRYYEQWKTHPLRFGPNHFPAVSHRDGNATNRKKCMVCHHRVNHHCVTCGVALCMGTAADDTTDTCWVKFHTWDDPRSLTINKSV